MCVCFSEDAGLMCIFGSNYYQHYCHGRTEKYMHTLFFKNNVQIYFYADVLVLTEVSFKHMWDNIDTDICAIMLLTEQKKEKIAVCLSIHDS